MIGSIADTFGIGLWSEIFRFMWLINWGAYLFMVFIVLSFFFRTLKLWNEMSQQKRMGEDEYDQTI
jgi:hypothetical protein